MKPLIFGLLYISYMKKNDMNIKVKSEEELINIYLRNALLLRKCLEKHDLQFSLLTNNKRALINEIVKGNDFIKEIHFNLLFPEHINFFSAHYKLEVFKYLSTLDNDNIVGLLDLDVVVFEDFSGVLERVIRGKEIIVYDITDQVVPSYGKEKILNELKVIDKKIVIPKWYGGEFIFSTPNGFKALYEEIKPLIPVYKRRYKKITHQGDEIITSVAIERLKIKGYEIIDAGKLGLIGRFWSVPARHKQPNINYYINLPVVHLPADKRFLAKFADIKEYDKDIFIKSYKIYLAKNKKVFYLKLIKLNIEKYLYIVKQFISCKTRKIKNY